MTVWGPQIVTMFIKRNFLKIDKLLQKCMWRSTSNGLSQKYFPLTGRKLVQNFRFYRTADTPHFNYKRKPTAVLIQGANSGLF